MIASEISSIAGAAGSTASNTATAELAENFDSFLTLLTTQLQYQDPLEPMDSSEFTQQLVQFTQVEQSISTNKNLEQLISLQANTQAVAAVGYLGKTVAGKGEMAPLADGAATWSYTLDQTASANVVRIVNSAGKTVKTLTGEVLPGTHTFKWDGKDNSGILQPEGVYSLIANPLDAKGDPTKATVTFSGKVTSVSTEDGNFLISVGGVDLPIENLLSVTETPVAGT